MSGGHWEYIHHRLDEIAEALNRIDRVICDDDGPDTPGVREAIEAAVGPMQAPVKSAAKYPTRAERRGSLTEAQTRLLVRLAHNGGEGVIDPENRRTAAVLLNCGLIMTTDGLDPEERDDPVGPVDLTDAGWEAFDAR